MTAVFTACSAGNNLQATPNTVALAPALPKARSMLDLQQRTSRVDQATADSLSATSAHELFSADFEMDGVGTQPAGWDVSSGSWSICRAQNSMPSYCESEIRGMTEPIIHGDHDWTNYAVDASFSSAQKADEQGEVMLIGRIVDPTHYYFVGIRTDARSRAAYWYIGKQNGVISTEVAGGPIVIRALSEYTLRLAFRGSVIAAYLASNHSTEFVSLGSASDTSYTSGSVGLRTTSSSRVRFNSFRVTQRDDSGPPPPQSTSAPNSVSGRVIAWQEGDQYQEVDAGDGQTQQPSFSEGSPDCNGLDCSGGKGSITYHVSRPNLSSPSRSYRSMMVLTSNVLKDGGTYDCVFQTTGGLQPDAWGTQNLIWQDHNISGSLNTSLGITNYDGKGTRWYMNTGGSTGIGTTAFPHTWEAPYVHGEVDDWEIQWKNTNSSSGWLDLYRNGAKVDHYSGPNIVAGTEYDVVGIGLYEWDWKLPHYSTLLSQTITFSNFAMYTISGPIAPQRTVK